MSSSVSPSITYRPLSAPRTSGEVLLEPGLDAYADQIRANRDLLTAAEDVLIDDLPLPEFRQLARRNLLETACRYTWSGSRPFPLPERDVPLILSGHQPALFHAGVWYKNFVAGTLAQKTGGLALHVIADSDVAAVPSVLVPSGAADRLSWIRVPYDLPGDRLAWEVTAVEDMPTFRSFADRVRQALPPEHGETLLETCWPEIVRDVEGGATPAAAFSQARHRLESEWGLQSLEAPLGKLCLSEGFLRFTLHLLRHLPRLHLAYNESVQEFRQVHHIRSTAHPVPCLEEKDGQLEAPLWVWTTDRPRRHRVMVKEVEDRFELSDRQGWQAVIPSEGPAAVEALRKLAADGVSLRPKALLTTMFLRLAVADGFIHGIGGAKYDQVTDAILARFFGVTPPGFQVATATLHLPLPGEEEPFLSAAEAQAQLRDLRFNPDRYLTAETKLRPGVLKLLEAKRDLLSDIPEKQEKIAWHQRLMEVNRQLSTLVGQAEDRLQAALASGEAAAARQAVRQFREYPWCLYPAKTLRTLLLDLSHHEA